MQWYMTVKKAAEKMSKYKSVTGEQQRKQVTRRIWLPIVYNIAFSINKKSNSCNRRKAEHNTAFEGKQLELEARYGLHCEVS
jgi:hypothetical protein